MSAHSAVPTSPSVKPIEIGGPGHEEDVRWLVDSVYRAQKMVSIGKLAGGIAHEFNNFQQNIVASLELVRNLVATGRGAEAERFIASAIEAAQRAAELNQRYRAIVGVGEVAARPISLNDVVSKAALVFQRALPRYLTLATELTADLWLTKCSPDEAQAAIVNMVVAACEVAPEHGSLILRTRNVHAMPAGQEGSQTQSTVNERFVEASITFNHSNQNASLLELSIDALSHPVGVASFELAAVRHFARRYHGDARIEIVEATTLTLILPGLS